MTGATSYDTVEYPAGLYPTTHPAHMAAIARLHGLDAPDPATARVLEIAGGDGVNLISMAAALPDARFLSFDLSTAAVTRGLGLVKAAQLENIVVGAGDLLDAAENLGGPFDYIIAHGLYAWVPGPVREAALKLIGRTLSPEGIAFVSYNAKPGGHLRIAIREMLLHGLTGIEGHEARLGRAREILSGFVAGSDHDRPLLAGMRDVATPMLRKSAGSLFHDELGEVFEPQSLSEVITAANRHDLAFLNDAIPAMVRDGLPGTDLDDDATVFAAQTSDYAALAFFHQTLLIRPGRSPARTLDPANIATIYASSNATRTDATKFMAVGNEIEIEDPEIADFIDALGQRQPERLSLAPFAVSATKANMLLNLYGLEVIDLHSTPYPGAVTPGERPRTSPVILGQIAMGLPRLFTLDQRVVAFPEPGPRHFLSLLDGTRDHAALSVDWAASPFGDQISVDAALAQLARAGLLLA